MSRPSGLLNLHTSMTSTRAGQDICVKICVHTRTTRNPSTPPKLEHRLEQVDAFSPARMGSARCTHVGSSREGQLFSRRESGQCGLLSFIIKNAVLDVAISNESRDLASVEIRSSISKYCCIERL
jgi:hypothetical protein